MARFKPHCFALRSPSAQYSQLPSSLSITSRESKLTVIFQLSRLARRGGVKRISAGIYDEVRVAMEDRLRLVSFQTTSKYHFASCFLLFCR